MIYDVDMTTSDRTNPTPQSSDKSTSNMSLQTLSSTYKPNADDTRDRMQMINGSLVYYDITNTPRILIGKAPDDGRTGIWVSKEGINVITELGG